MMTTAAEVNFRCPGEEHAISRSVHLARLAAFYPACRRCEHRNDTGLLSGKTLKQLDRVESRVAPETLLSGEGFRGIYLNDLTRGRAAELAGALAAALWRKAPLVAVPQQHGVGTGGQAASGTRAERVGASARRVGPLVVVGHDERPSAPDLATGVVSKLRVMGCRCVDVGLATRPVFEFAVDHLQAAAGIHITGAGCDPAWIGLDFVSSRARPFSRDSLTKLESDARGTSGRPTRQPGSLRAFHAAIPYEAGLWKHFHALRPLKVVVGCPGVLLRKLLHGIFGRLPCRLSLVELPRRRRNVADADDPDCHRISRFARQQHAHLAVLIDDDGQSCAFFDERGNWVAPTDILRLFAECCRREHTHCTVALESGALENGLDQTAGLLGELGIRTVAGGPTGEQMWTAMEAQAALLGGGTSGRFWFREAFSTCDAVLSIAKVLQALSRSDANFSEILTALPGGRSSQSDGRSRELPPGRYCSEG